MGRDTSSATRTAVSVTSRRFPRDWPRPRASASARPSAFLRAAYPDVVVEAGEEGLLAPNFYVDDQLSGRLTGAADDDLVTVIIGGDPCGVGM